MIPPTSDLLRVLICHCIDCLPIMSLLFEFFHHILDAHVFHRLYKASPEHFEHIQTKVVQHLSHATQL